MDVTNPELITVGTIHKRVGIRFAEQRRICGKRVADPIRWNDLRPIANTAVTQHLAEACIVTQGRVESPICKRVANTVYGKTSTLLGTQWLPEFLADQLSKTRTSDPFHTVRKHICFNRSVFKSLAVGSSGLFKTDDLIPDTREDGDALLSCPPARGDVSNCNIGVQCFVIFVVPYAGCHVECVSEYSIMPGGFFKFRQIRGDLFFGVQLAASNQNASHSRGHRLGH